MSIRWFYWDLSKRNLYWSYFHSVTSIVDFVVDAIKLSFFCEKYSMDFNKWITLHCCIIRPVYSLSNQACTHNPTSQQFYEEIRANCKRKLFLSFFMEIFTAEGIYFYVIKVKVLSIIYTHRFDLHRKAVIFVICLNWFYDVRVLALAPGLLRRWYWYIIYIIILLSSSYKLLLYWYITLGLTIYILLLWNKFYYQKLSCSILESF